MKIIYDLEALPERNENRGHRSEEVKAVIAFLASPRKNMCFEYDDDKECKRRYNTLMNYRRVYKLQEVFGLFQKDNRIYIVKTKKKGAE